MIKAQQVGSIPVSGQQATMLPMQAGVIPATTTATQLDMSSIMNMMIMMMVVVMMMKMMTSATEKI